jgi:hypothetical protein
VAACLLTNAAESEALYREVFSEVFGGLTGVTMPAPPRPVLARCGIGIGRGAGAGAGAEAEAARGQESREGRLAVTRGWSCQAGMVAM